MSHSHALLFAASIAAPWGASAAPDRYLATPVAGKYVGAGALTDQGRYALNNSPPEIPYQLASIGGAGRSESVGSPGGFTTRIRALNNAGDAVGESATGSGAFDAFLYANGRMDDLTARYGLASPVAINDRGEIAGQTLDYRAAVLRNGVVDAFGPERSGPADINERGQVLLAYAPQGIGWRPAIWSGGILHDLPRFAGQYVSGDALNDAGWVTGYATTAIGGYHAFVYDGGTVTDLTPWSGTSFGYDINNLGQVVGTVDGRAFLYEDGMLTDLNALVDPQADLLLTAAIAINDRGQILANSCDRAGVFCYSTMLLDPVPAVPEPGMWALLLGGWPGWACASPERLARPRLAVLFPPLRRRLDQGGVAAGQAACQVGAARPAFEAARGRCGL